VVLAQPCPKPGPAPWPCDVSIVGDIDLVVCKVVDLCHKVVQREEVFSTHLWLIEDCFHLLIVGNGRVQQILVL
jgi:hypothetical protein